MLHDSMNLTMGFSVFVSPCLRITCFLFSLVRFALSVSISAQSISVLTPFISFSYNVRRSSTQRARQPAKGKPVPRIPQCLGVEQQNGMQYLVLRLFAYYKASCISQARVSLCLSLSAS